MFLGHGVMPLRKRPAASLSQAEDPSDHHDSDGKDKTTTVTTRSTPRASTKQLQCAICLAIEGTSIDVVQGGPIRWADYHFVATASTGWSAEKTSARGDICYVCSRVRSVLDVKLPPNKRVRASAYFKTFMAKRAEWVHAHILGAHSGPPPRFGVATATDSTQVAVATGSTTA